MYDWWDPASLCFKILITKKKFRLSKPDLMLSSSLRNQSFSVDMRPLLTGGAHGDNKSHSSGIVALFDKLRQIYYQRSAKIWFVWRIAVDLSWAAGKKWQNSNVVIPTLGLMCLYSSLPTLFQTGIFSPITIHKAQSRINVVNLENDRIHCLVLCVLRSRVLEPQSFCCNSNWKM